MPNIPLRKVKALDVYNRIRNVERFAVRIERREDDSTVEVRDKLRRYKFQNRAPNGWTVEKWIRLRFDKYYPDYRVKVLNADGEAMDDDDLLQHVRDTYASDAKKKKWRHA